MATPPLPMATRPPRPLMVGDVEIPGWAGLAPMAGVSDIAFRSLARRWGCGLVVTEMVSVNALTRGRGRGLDKTRKLMRIDPEGRPTAVQLFGGDPVAFTEAARQAEEAGADIVDINMGCPVKKIVKQRAGAALLQEPERAADIVAAAVAGTGRPVTVKLRAGWDAGSMNAPEIAAACVAAGAKGIAVHGRTRAQGYAGVSSRDLIRAVVDAVPGTPVFGNGDVATAADAHSLREETGCAGVLIGRGALGNPMIFAELNRGEQFADRARARAQAFREHVELYRQYNEDRPNAVHILRKHLLWYTRGFRGAAVLREKLHDLHTYAQIMETAELVFRLANDAANASNAVVPPDSAPPPGFEKLIAGWAP